MTQNYNYAQIRHLLRYECCFSKKWRENLRCKVRTAQRRQDGILTFKLQFQTTLWF